MKVCLINPPTSRAQDDVFFPMGLVTIASILRENGISAEIVDFDIQLRRRPDLREGFSKFCSFAREEIASKDAEVFGISSICSNFPFAFELAEMIREEHPESKIVLGGPQPSSVAPESLAYCPAVDVVVIGEGEITFLELLRSNWKPPSLAKIPGLCYRSDDGIRQSEARPLIEDLDTLPFPDFSLIDVREYQNHSCSVSLLEAGRGCPFRCNFCSTAEMWVRKYRVKSPERIAEEMRRIQQRFAMTYISLTHDNFSTSPKYLRKFCRYFIDNGLQGYTWNASARTDTLKIDDLDLMQQAGCRGVFFGVDTGSKRVQDLIDKHLDLDEFRLILGETVKRGIHAISSFILGFPEETHEDLNATVELGLWAKYAGSGEVQFHRLAPLASTKIYAQHFKDLNYSPVVSDISFIIFSDPELLQKIQAHPRLFSSYFELPLPQVQDIDIFCFSNFYHALVNDIGPSLYWYLKKVGKKPIDFYKEWYQQHSQEAYTQLLKKPYVLDTVGDCF